MTVKEMGLPQQCGRPFSFSPARRNCSDGDAHGLSVVGDDEWRFHRETEDVQKVEFTPVLGHSRPMRPSLAFAAHREEIRRIVETNRGLNPRVFGSVLHGDDTEDSDLDILIDAAPRFTLFDMARIALEVEQLINTKVMSGRLTICLLNFARKSSLKRKGYDHRCR